MTYELRKWFDGEYCLFTDDPRLRDYAARQPGMKIVGKYFGDHARAAAGLRPTAWDIAGGRDQLQELAYRFSGSRSITAA